MFNSKTISHITKIPDMSYFKFLLFSTYSSGRFLNFRHLLFLNRHYFYGSKSKRYEKVKCLPSFPTPSTLLSLEKILNHSVILSEDKSVHKQEPLLPQERKVCVCNVWRNLVSMTKVKRIFRI